MSTAVIIAGGGIGGIFATTVYRDQDFPMYDSFFYDETTLIFEKKLLERYMGNHGLPNFDVALAGDQHYCFHPPK